MLSKGLQNFTIPNPGNLGLNTQDSPLTLPLGFATTASNCVIDKKGRIAARKGREYVTTTGGTSSVIEQIFEAKWADDTTTVFSVGANKIYTGTTTLTDITGAATITDNDWQIAQLQDVVYFFQAGHAPLQYTKSAGSLDEITSASGYVATVQEGTCCLSAFGRLWTAKGETVYWSDLLDGVNWGGGTSGSLDLNTVFPRDVDEVVALAAHNNYLVVFLKRNILVYEGANNPAMMKLLDTIVDIGCEMRDSVVNIGSDVLFLDRSGMRSLGRTIQEKSAPLGKISRNVNTDLTALLSAANAGEIKGCYSRKNRFVWLTVPSASTVYVFDTQFPLEDGSYRTTTWEGITDYCAVEMRDGSLYFGSTDGIMEYSSLYTDEGVGYDMSLYTPYNSMGVPFVLKVGKEVDITTEGVSGGTYSLKWAYDWSTSYKTASVSVESGTVAEFGEGEFGEGEFGSLAGINVNHVQINGSGRDISLGVESSINGAEIAIQEIDFHAIIGRIK